MTNSQSPTTRLLIYLFSRNVSSLSEGIKALQNSKQRFTKVKSELEVYRQAVRSASDADPRWTDEEIDSQILAKINEIRVSKGLREI